MKRHPNLVLFTLLLAVLAVAVVLTRRAGPGSEPTYVSRTEEIMATPISVLLPEAAGAEAAEAVFAVFRRVDAEMSEWKSTSPLSAVIAAAGERPVEVPADLFDLLEFSVGLGEATGGAFDCTWAALWGVWDFRAETPALPAEDLIAQRLALVDYRRLELDRASRTAFLPEPGMKVGLGGIAKGRALDLARAELQQREIGR
ncbi:MAG: FAD:protein FMN transferase, partial [Phycisphaerales bacterium JB038]